MNVDGRDILQLLRDFQFFILVGLVYDSILLQVEVHVEGFAFSLPGVAFCVVVDFLVPVEDLVDRLLTGDFQFVLVVAEGVDDPDPS